MSSTGRPALPEHIQHPSDKTLNRIVFALERSLKSLVDVPYLRGNLLEGVAQARAQNTRLVGLRWHGERDDLP
jgi:hypothetical protein